EQFHHGRTRNMGAEMAQGRYLVYITQDALPANNDWLTNLTAAFTEPRVAMVVGRQIAREDTKPPEKFFYYYNFPDFKLVVKSNADDYYHDNVFISDVNSAYRKDAWLKQKFSESIVTAEDKEIAIRFLADGYSIIYEPAAAVYHSHDYGLKGAFEKSLDYGLSLKQGVSRLPKSNKNLGGRMAEYMLAEYHFLKVKKYLKWVPYSIIYEGAKYAGLLMGKSGLLAGPMARRTKLSHE
ncbi:MAG: glycosyltransferase family 2 protein, partial [Dehalococcoidia bacterium]